MSKKILLICTTDSMIWNFLVPHIKKWEKEGMEVDCVSSKTGFYFDELVEDMKIRMFEIPFSRSPFKYRNIICLKSLNKLVKTNNYDVIICQEPVGGVMGRLVGKFNKIKVIYTAHGFHFYTGSPKKNWVLFYPIERFLSYFTDTLITSNEEDFQRAKRFKKRNVFKINGVGVDLKKFKCNHGNEDTLKKELGLPCESKVIINAAEMIERKNYKTAIKAFALANIPNCYFIICGTGTQEEKIRELVKVLNIENKVLFLGFRKDLEMLLKMSDVLLFPSYQEGLSVTLLSAMASGLPAVCSNIRGNIDVIDNNKGGYLYSPNNIEGFADGLRKALDKKSQFGHYNVQKVKNYELNKVVDYMYSIVLTTLDSEELI